MNVETKTCHILLVDDDPLVIKVYAERMRYEGWRVAIARDGWEAISNWRARHQFRWNKDSEEMSVKDILAFVLSRVGLKLAMKSQSTVITGFYPDFTINSGNLGAAVIRKLLSFVPDVLFIEGEAAYLVNPQSSDGSSYSYGEEHLILDGRYRRGAWEHNRLQVEGYDTGSDEVIVVFSNDYVAFAVENFTFVTQELEPGNYTIEVKATNQWGNSGYANQAIEIPEFLSTDLNQDGIVDIIDLSTVAYAFGTEEGDENYSALADLDKNGKVNVVDLSIVAMDYGKTM